MQRLQSPHCALCFGVHCVLCSLYIAQCTVYIGCSLLGAVCSDVICEALISEIAPPCWPDRAGCTPHTVRMCGVHFCFPFSNICLIFKQLLAKTMNQRHWLINNCLTTYKCTKSTKTSFEDLRWSSLEKGENFTDSGSSTPEFKFE